MSDEEFTTDDLIALLRDLDTDPDVGFYCGNLCGEAADVIEELRDDLRKEWLVGYHEAHSEDYIPISVEMVDLAWDGGRRPQTEYSNGFDAALRLLGIVECQNCQGIGNAIPIAGGEMSIGCPRCHGHGWIRKEAH
jgi:hypothetical protein